MWAIGYDSMERADQVRDKIARLAWDCGQAAKYLILLDSAVVVRHPDGTFTLDRRPFPAAGAILACTVVGFLAGERSRYGKLILDDSSSLAMKEGCQEFSLARKLMR